MVAINGCTALQIGADGLNEAAGQPALRFDDYLLNYMLKWETKASNTFLDIDSLADPFSYKLRQVNVAANRRATPGRNRNSG